MGYFSQQNYITPTKEQIDTALTKVQRVYELYKIINDRLEKENIEIKRWWGLRSEVMTKDQHIRKENVNSLMSYHTRAFILGYITEEEHRVWSFIWDSPSIKKLKEWKAAEKIYLGDDDHEKLMYALTEDV